MFKFPPSFTYVLVSNLAVRRSAQSNCLRACCAKTSGSEGPNQRCHSCKTRHCLDSHLLDNDLARYPGLFGLILKSRAVRITRLANYQWFVCCFTVSCLLPSALHDCMLTCLNSPIFALPYQRLLLSLRSQLLTTYLTQSLTSIPAHILITVSPSSEM